MSSTESYSTDCLQPLGFYVKHCLDGHSHQVAIRCKKYRSCEGCGNWYVKKWLSQAYKRFNQNCLDVSKVIMWTFGTSMPDNYTNREVIRGYWRTFCQRIFQQAKRDKFDWHPLLYVVEAGKNGFLHIHAILTTTLDQTLAKDKWRKISGEKSNVNFVYQTYCKVCGKFTASTWKQGRGQKYCHNCHIKFTRLTSEPADPLKAVAYVSKYVSKGLDSGTRNYYWMGDMLKKLDSEVYVKCGLGIGAEQEPCQSPVYLYEIRIAGGFAKDFILPSNYPTPDTKLDDYEVIT